VGESDVGDGGVEDLHEGAHGDDEGDDPRIEDPGLGCGFEGEAGLELGCAVGELFLGDFEL
jgi:hypothetical protein